MGGTFCEGKKAPQKKLLSLTKALLRWYYAHIIDDDDPEK